LIFLLRQKGCFLNKRAKNKLPTARELAVHLLARVENEGAYADRLLASRRVLELEPLDRSFVRELVLGVLRWKLRLDHIIDIYYNGKLKSLQPKVRNIIRLGLYQMMFMNSVPDWSAVDESVKITSCHRTRRAAGLVNAMLRRFGREGEPGIRSSDPVKKLSVEKSFPDWIVKKWIAKFGIETAETIMTASNERHPVSIRTNATKTDTESLASELSSEGFKTTTASGMPGYFIVLKGKELFETQAFKKGLFTAQDSAASMATVLLSPEPGETVLDLCSAPGGKVTHIAEIMGDSGYIDAVDINKKRLELAEKAAKRLGLKSINFIEDDTVKFKNESGVQYDRILFDAPCTGTGVFSKRPDMKWRRKNDDMVRITSLQKAILRNAVSLVKPGGVIVYSTCSLEPEENEDIVNWFVNKYDFSIERDDHFKNFEIDGGYLIFPHLMDGAGAFAAKLRNKLYG